MAARRVTVYGRQVRDEHTHYEVSVFAGSDAVTVLIPGYIAGAFQKKYGRTISECDRFVVNVDFSRNDERVGECQDPFLVSSHLMGSVASLDDINLILDD